MADTGTEKTTIPQPDLSHTGKVDSPERAAYSPREFAQFFGRSQTWAYRLIYAGKVRVLDNLGATLIPRSELDRIVKSAKVYSK